MEIEDDSKEPGTIVQEIQKGFMLKDRLLRPSLVGVSKKQQKMKEKEPKKQDMGTCRFRKSTYMSFKHKNL